MRIKRLTPSPSMIVALIALFVTLSGVAYAATTLSNNSVRSRHIVNGQVKRVDLAASAVGTAKIANNAVSAAKLAGNAVDSSKVADGGIELADLSAATLAGARGTVYQGYQDAALAVDGTDAASGTVVLALPVPAGLYAINAKVQLDNNSPATPTTGACRLTTGADWDEALAGLNVDSDVNDVNTLPMTVVGTFPAAGTIELRCTDFGTGNAVASWRKIVAVQVGTIVKTPSP